MRGYRVEGERSENAARDSLDDVRGVVGLMRGDGRTTVSPTPGLADIPGLVDTYRNAGAGIDLDLRAIPPGITAGRGLTVYRIVQESLTNAVRHGDGGSISLRIDASGGDTRITVRNGGAPRGQPRHGTGITAMYERAGALGGTLAAGPAPGGWLVEAVIPS